VTRIVTTHYRYKPPPRKLALPAEREKAEPAAVVRKVKPCNDNRPGVSPQNKPAAIVRTAQPSRATHKTPKDSPKPAIVTSHRGPVPRLIPPVRRVRYAISTERPRHTICTKSYA
jgi:hypothetical protein